MTVPVRHLDIEETVIEALDDLTGCGCCGSADGAEAFLGPDGCPTHEEWGGIAHAYGEDCIRDTRTAIKRLVRHVARTAWDDGARAVYMRPTFGSRPTNPYA